MRRKFFQALGLAALVASGSRPLPAVNKETLRMMQQLDDMQQQLQALQKTVDTQTAILRTLIEQTNDKVTAMRSDMEELKKTTQHDLAGSSARFDAMGTQMQALSESLEETKARLSKLGDQLAQMQNMIQTLNTPPATANAAGAAPAAGAGGTAAPPPKPQAPDPDTLLRSGYTYLTSGQYDLAIQAFQQYLENYGTTDRALDAQFYIGEAYYAQGKYDQAVDAYNKCLERYPSGSKLPAAQLEKGYALLALNQKVKGIRELRSLIQRFPTSHEADLARQRLRRLGAAAR